MDIKRLPKNIFKKTLCKYADLSSLFSFNELDDHLNHYNNHLKVFKF